MPPGKVLPVQLPPGEQSIRPGWKLDLGHDGVPRAALKDHCRHRPHHRDQHSNTTNSNDAKATGNRWGWKSMGLDIAGPPSSRTMARGPWPHGSRSRSPGSLPRPASLTPRGLRRGRPPRRACGALPRARVPQPPMPQPRPLPQRRQRAPQRGHPQRALWPGHGR